ncbi:cAMP-regulated D2 protein-like [Styela clava]
MAQSKTIAFFVAGFIPVAIVVTTLSILLTSNNDLVPPDVDAGYVIAQIPRIGRLRGFLTNESTAVFYGLPFSQSTAGEYRWQKPRDPLPVEDDYKRIDAFKKPKACPQVCVFPSPEYSCPPVEDMSEDCLNLNVFVPSRLTKREASHRKLMSDSEEKLAVMVYIYGGAFMAGGNAIPLYDARYLSEWGDIIVVTINYRLGAFGFFYQDDGTSTAALGNFGIYDQIKALEWVHRHIADFGGDPNQVTLFGQSAGAQSIAVLMLQDEVNHLFQRVVMQSNPFGLPYKDVSAAQALGNSFARWARCAPNDLNCLRGLSMEELLERYKTLPYAMQLNAQHISEIFEPYSPILDGILLDNDPMYLFKEGKNQDKPMIVGYVEDEGAMFVGEIYSSPIQSQRIYKASAQIIFRQHTDIVVDLYPPQCPRINPQETDCDERIPMDDAVTDYMFTCPGRKAMNSDRNKAKENADIWFYTFNETWSFPEFWENYTLCWEMVCHTEEVPYLFDIDKLTEYRFEDGEAELAARMRTFWVNFAKYGNPNGPPETAQEVPVSDNLDGIQSINKQTGEEFQQSKAKGQIYWPRFFETDQSDPNTSYRVLQMTAHGDREINDFRKEYCDKLDDLDYYLENYNIPGLLMNIKTKMNENEL